MRLGVRASPLPRVAPAYGEVQLAFVHHTENPNGYSPGEVPAMLRAIFAVPPRSHGWNDIGYNFVVDRFGRIFEARAGGIDEPVAGAQAGGYNFVSNGRRRARLLRAVRISAPARRSLQRLLAWKLSLHGAPPTGRGRRPRQLRRRALQPVPGPCPRVAARIAGHRDGRLDRLPAATALYAAAAAGFAGACGR